MTSKNRHTITVFIPAYNEEINLANAVSGALNAIKNNFSKYDILILNAYSSDKTGEIAERLSDKNPNIRVIHRKNWHGLGANVKKGIEQATMEYFVMFPGDNENSWVSLSETLKKIGSTDIIIPYTINKQARAFYRRIISSWFVFLLNFLFRLKLKYYNGNAVYKTDMIKRLHIHSEDFAYNAEILVKLIKSGYSYTEIGIHIQPTQKTAIFGVRNIVGVIRSVIYLFLDVNIINRNQYKY